MSARTLSELATLQQLIEADPPTLTVPNRLRFASASLNAFTLELTEQLQRLRRRSSFLHVGKNPGILPTCSNGC